MKARELHHNRGDVDVVTIVACYLEGREALISKDNLAYYVADRWDSKLTKYRPRRMLSSNLASGASVEVLLRSFLMVIFYGKC